MFGASDTVVCTKMLMDTCCSCDFFLATSQEGFFVWFFFFQVKETVLLIFA